MASPWFLTPVFQVRVLVPQPPTAVTGAWRNWSTRRIQNPVTFGSCGFESHRSYHRDPFSDPRGHERAHRSYVGSQGTHRGVRFPAPHRGGQGERCVCKDCGGCRSRVNVSVGRPTTYEATLWKQSCQIAPEGWFSAFGVIHFARLVGTLREARSSIG